MKDTKTTSILSMVFLIMFFITRRNIFLYISGTLILIYNFIPPIDRMISKIWLKISEIIGNFNSRVILTVIYYLFLTPLSVLRRINKNPLWLKKPKVDTYWKERNKTYTKEDLIKGW